MNEIQPLAAQGAERILRECLLLERSDVLALFWDESATDPATLIREAARRIDLDLCERQLSIREQSAFDPRRGLSARDHGALNSARGVLTCLSSSPTCTSYRTALVNAGTTAGVRFGHMPGVDVNVLASAVHVNYEEAEQRCDDLTLALALGERAEVETYACDDKGHLRSYRMTMSLGGLARPPISSTGRIPIGTWGNIPGGEAFIAPIENTAEGAFVLNGSFKNRIVHPPDALILQFTKGRLVEVRGAADLKREFERLFEPAREQDDPSFDLLAELGIGVNSGVAELTGNALFDEKCSGTAHIAVGDSARYGGQQHSVVHEDLVTRRPSIWIDGKQVMQHGANVFRPEEWRDRIDTTVVSTVVSGDEFVVRRTNVRADFDDRGLKVRREVAAGRICSYRLGDEATARLLLHVYELVPPLPATAPFSQLKQDAGLINAEIDEESLRKSLTILLRHHMVDVLADRR